MDADARSAARRRLVRFLARGGLVVREAVGGAIGVRCCGAARNGREFDPQALARLIETGATFKGRPYLVVRDQAAGRPAAAEVFRFQLQEETPHG